MAPTDSTLIAATFADLSTATLFYLVLYLTTLVLHVVFMGYVLAGTAYLAAIVTVRIPGERGPFEALLREWLPFMLSLAITAGIAPLLFLQILYRPQFYTANLLLFHRWMAVVPVLIVGFYLLYLLKVRWSETRSRVISLSIAVVAAVCFTFIAWSWTENHLLGLAGQPVWTEQYASQSLVYHSAQVLPRLAMWFCGTFAILAVWLSWQIWWPQRSGMVEATAGARRAAVVGLSGLTLAVGFAGLYWVMMPQGQRAALTTSAVLVAWTLVAVGLVGTIVLFVQQMRSQRLTGRRLSVLSTSLLCAMVGAACLRESLRLHVIDVSSHVDTHESAAAVGGRWVFAAFFVINGLLIAWCLRVAVSQRTKAGSSNDADSLP